MSFGNTPWHTSTEFNNAIRVSVGADLDVTADVWCQCRKSAETKIFSYLPDSRKRYRTMCNRVPGERFPQEGFIESTDAFEYAVLLPNIVTTPAIFKPRVFKNLSRPWEFRYEEDGKRLTLGTDFTFTETCITILNPAIDDVYYVDYRHTLETIPAMLNMLSLYGTAELVLLRNYGRNSEQFDVWAAAHRAQYHEELKMIEQGRLSIDEFDRVNLYEDWADEDPGPVAFRLERG